MVLPNFVVIGAGKSGTTSLYFYLKQHPEIYLPSVKELNFFAVEGENFSFSGPKDESEARKYFYVNNLSSYQALFESVQAEKAIGDVSPFYIYSDKAPERIQHYIPQAKVIAILRNPVDRAYSNYLHLLRDGRETLTSFEDAIDAEESRIQSNWSPSWHYANAGLYCQLLARYYERFDREKIKIFLYEDYLSNSSRVLSSIFEFLDVDSTFVPNSSTRYNASGIPKNPLVHKLLSNQNPIRNFVRDILPSSFTKSIATLRDKNLDKPPALSSITRDRLMAYYREDILKLQDLTDIDLSRWMKN